MIMGYYTSYTLAVQGISELQVAALCLCMKDNNVMAYFDEDDTYVGGNKTLYFSSSDTYKWYEHEEDMKKLSKLFPNAVFKLSGNGEDYTDNWDKYFYNGIMEYCPWTPTEPKGIVWRNRDNID
jgi:hypothetical protein